MYGVSAARIVKALANAKGGVMTRLAEETVGILRGSGVPVSPVEFVELEELAPGTDTFMDSPAIYLMISESALPIQVCLRRV